MAPRIVGFAFIAGGVLLNPWVLAMLVTPKLLHHRYALCFMLLMSVVAIGLGVMLLRYQAQAVRRQVMAIGMSTLVTLVLAELGLRGFYATANVLSTPKRFVTAELGWETTGNIDQKYHRPGFGDIHYQTVEHGFRCLDRGQPGETRVLVIGDSYTQATQVSNGDAFYDVLGQSNDRLAISAIGCGGYGTLQESMLLKRWFEELQPDVVVWQFSDNDIINNDFDLECASVYNNNHMTRPYWQADQIVRRFPAKSGRLVQQYSYLVRHVMIVVGGLLAGNDSIDSQLDWQHPGFQRSLRTTADILADVRRLVGDTPVVALAAYEADAPAHLRRGWREICQANGIHFLDDITTELESAMAAGQAVTGGDYDAHWNQTGHRIVGEQLARHFESLGLAGNSDSTAEADAPSPSAGRDAKTDDDASEAGRPADLLERQTSA